MRTSNVARTSTLAALSAGLLLTLAACGGDDPPPAPDAGSTEDLELESTGEPDDGGDDSSDSGDAGGEYCTLLNDFGDDILSGGSMTDPDAAAEFVDVYRQIADAAPEDIAADWTALADAMETMSTIDLADPDAASQLEEFDDLGEVSQRIGQHVTETCS